MGAGACVLGTQALCLRLSRLSPSPTACPSITSHSARLRSTGHHAAARSATVCVQARETRRSRRPAAVLSTELAGALACFSLSQLPPALSRDHHTEVCVPRAAGWAAEPGVEQAMLSNRDGVGTATTRMTAHCDKCVPRPATCHAAGPQAEGQTPESGLSGVDSMFPSPQLCPEVRRRPRQAQAGRPALAVTLSWDRAAPLWSLAHARLSAYTVSWRGASYKIRLADRGGSQN